MNIEYKINLSLYFIILVLLILFLFTRFDLITLQFTHYDDLFAPYVLDLISSYEPKKFVSQLYKYKIINDINFENELVAFFSSHPTIFTVIKRILGPIAVASTSTFAPLQFLFTSFILNLDISYEHSLFTSRFFSLFFSLMAFLVFIFFSLSFKDDLKKIFIIYGGFLISSSWMFIVYSTQAENFSVTIFCASILLLILQKNKEPLSYSNFTWISLLCFLLILLNYQTLFLIPGFYLALYFQEKNKVKAITKYLICSLPVIIAFLIMLKFVSRIKAGAEVGVHWNAGPNNQYFFSKSCGFFQFFCFIEFIFFNITDVIKSLFVFFNVKSLLANYYANIIIVVSLLGIYELYNSKQYRNIFYFIFTSFLIWFLLIFFQKLTFSPTRHSLIYAYLFICCFCFGILFIYKKFFNKIKFIALLFSFTLIAALIAFFSYSYNSIKEERSDFLDIDLVKKIINENNVTQIITYDMTTQLHFEPEIRNNFDIKFINEHPYIFNFIKKKNSENGKILILCLNAGGCIDPKWEKKALIKLGIFPNSYSIVYSLNKNSKITNCFGNFAGAGLKSINLLLIKKL
jgi:hypothetical protein